MTDRIARTTCALALDRYCRASGQTQRTYERGNFDTWAEGELTLWDESGVKRLCAYVMSDGGTPTAVRDIGPGFSTWRELYGFLQGMIQAEYLRAESTVHA
jgi:hypothetical protein